MHIKGTELFPGTSLHFYVVRIIRTSLICNCCQSNSSRLVNLEKVKNTVGWAWASAREKNSVPTCPAWSAELSPAPLFLPPPRSHEHSVMLTLALQLSCFEFERSTFIISNTQPRAKTDKAIWKDEVQQEAGIPIVQPFGNRTVEQFFYQSHKCCSALLGQLSSTGVGTSSWPPVLGHSNGLLCSGLVELSGFTHVV